MIHLPLTTTRHAQLYQESIEHPQTFWAEQAQQYIHWFKPWTAVQTGSFATHDIRWYIKGQLNACYNCLDRHLPQRADQVALIWEGNEPHQSRYITYAELHKAVCQLAQVLRNQGIRKGDRVGLYMPMIPEALIAMLACARIGAIHSVIFAGFSAEALKNRLLDADCSAVITADESVRGTKRIPLKENCDQALLHCPQVRTVWVVQRTGNPIPWHANRDVWYHEAMATAPSNSPAEWMESNDPLFILYTSGSTGKPKGILHATGGYLVYAAITHHVVFNYSEGDIYWCTADIGWITGHTYAVYGPLANGGTTLLFEGIPNYPSDSRYWQIVDKHQVHIFYTAPTVIRALMREGDAPVRCTQRTSLKLLGTVGEPINPNVWQWYYDIVGEKRCPIVDTWWQTETGGIALTPFPHVTPLKPGATSWPFFGIHPQVVDDQGRELAPNQTGKLILTQPWPGMMQTIYADHSRFIHTYFKEFPGAYLTGDGAYCDTNGYFWITGRIDDVINVSGHRLGTAEIESALLRHHSVAEAAVIGFPHDIKGEGIYAFVTTKTHITPSEELKKELIQTVRDVIGPIATPDRISWAPALPKTRS